ncbi:MAG: flagellar hook assembly protein FlgD [Alphaproteobacteria bacterium]|nr:flagellar hook assembly protein FlgD [Alphaproteobacteria bacterium]
MVSDVTFSGQAAQAQQTQQQSVTLAEDFSQFLNLLTTQLQNQDPLSPLDSNQFTEQLVQFSQVEQAINTNTKLDDLVALQLNNAATSALGYVGLDVSYVSAEIALEEGQGTTIKYSLDRPAAVSKINIFTEGNELVFSGDIEGTVGAHEFEWNGKDLLGNDLPSGTYVVSIDAVDIEENPVNTTSVVTARVRGIEQQDGNVFALVGERAVPIGSILNAVIPEQTNDGGVDGPTT